MNRPLHIALVTETWRPEVNGVAMTLGHMVDGLMAAGHRISLVRPRQHKNDAIGSRAKHPESPSCPDELLVAGCPIPGYQGLRFGLPARRALTRHWRQICPDIVQVATEGPLGASAIAAARSLSIPVISEFHTNFHSYSKYYGVGWFAPLVAAHMRRLHNRSDATLVPTHALAQDLERSGYRDVHVVARGVDTRLFNPQRRSQDLRRQWGAESNDLVVMHVGRLAPEKNLPLVLHAFNAICTDQPNSRLVFVGDGPQRKSLERATQQRVNSPCIFTGMRREVDLAVHYASGDLFLFPSLTETFGNVVTEAIASGLAVVAYRQAGAADIIVHRHNGLLANAGDSQSFIGLAVELASDATLRHRVRQTAADSARHLDWERVNCALLNLMRSTIDHTSTSHAVRSVA